MPPPHSRHAGEGRYPQPPRVPAFEHVSKSKCRLHPRSCVLETAALRPPQDDEVFDSIKKTPHPEEAAKQLSRRTHCANPADLRFFHMLLRRDDEADAAEMRQLISSGSTFEAEAGYSRAVVDGEWIFVAGTTGFDYAQMTIAEDPAEQTRQAFRNIENALAEADASLADVVRVRYYVPNLADWPAIVAVLGKVFGAIRPAATALICGLVDPRMKIEVEVTARRGTPP